MQTAKIVAIPAALGLLTACAGGRHHRDATFATAVLLAPDGASHGTATLVAGPRGLVRVEGSVSGLSPGKHGVHLHAVGRCDAPDFASAGPHLNPYAKHHGSDNPQGSHLGDLPNLVIDADGTGAFSTALDADAVTLAPLLFDADGTALVVHASPDDYKTDPSGNSGARIACGVLRKQD